MTLQPVPSAPAFLRLATLDDDQERLRLRLTGQLDRVKLANRRQEDYYEGARAVRDLGIAIPPHLKDLEAVAGWPEIVVDVVNERLEWRGWVSNGGPDLSAVFAGNHLDVEVSQATLDSLICGVSFLSAGAGDEGEPDVLVKAESPSRMTGFWDARLRRLTSAVSEDIDEQGSIVGWTLDLPNERVIVRLQGGRMTVVDRDQHGLNRVPVVALFNRPRSSRVGGRSEITRSVRSLTDSAMRTLLGMEVAREFYAAPQRYIMGADESMFMDEQGNRLDQWKAIIGRVLALPKDENGDTPEVNQFQAASPAPFTEVLKTYSQMVSAATGIPATHLGFSTDNPASEGAIQRGDVRLDKRAMLRQRQYDLGLNELGVVCSLWRDGVLPEPGSIGSRWVPVSLVAPGAAADRATKAIAAGVLDPSWDITARQFGFTDDEVLEIRRERRRAGGSAALQAIAAARQNQPAPVVAPLALPDA